MAQFNDAINEFVRAHEIDPELHADKLAEQLVERVFRIT